MTPRPKLLRCSACAQAHQLVDLRAGERAQCVRCSRPLVKRSWFGRDAPLAFAVTALVMGIPAVLLPFVTVSKFGNARISYVLSGVESLWRHNLGPLATWVLFCGLVAPFVLLLLLFFCLCGERLRLSQRALGRTTRAAGFVQEWAMPEVHVLAVLVAFFKLGDLVEVSVGLGLWCYAVAAFLSLLAWRSYSLAPETVMQPQEESSPA